MLTNFLTSIEHPSSQFTSVLNHTTTNKSHIVAQKKTYEEYFPPTSNLIQNKFLTLAGPTATEDSLISSDEKINEYQKKRDIIDEMKAKYSKISLVYIVEW